MTKHGFFTVPGSVPGTRFRMTVVGEGGVVEVRSWQVFKFESLKV
jgi:hypothetical protein